MDGNGFSLLSASAHFEISFFIPLASHYYPGGSATTETLTEPCSVVQCILNVHKGLHYLCQKVITRFVMKYKWPEKEEEIGLKQQHEPKMVSFWQNLIRNKESGE